MKNKPYATAVRTPMMYGGAATPKKRKKMATGDQATANAETQSRLATGRATKEDKSAAQTQRLEEMMRMSIPTLRRIKESDKDATERGLAGVALQRKGDKGAMPPGDQQPTE